MMPAEVSAKEIEMLSAPCPAVLRVATLRRYCPLSAVLLFLLSFASAGLAQQAVSHSALRKAVYTPQPGRRTALAPRTAGRDTLSSPAASSGTINDTDGGFTYSGPGWGYYSGRGVRDYQDDVHATSNSGDAASYTFTGTGISYITETNGDEGNVQIYLDGTLQSTVNCYSSGRLVQQTVWSSSGLSSGSHTLKLVNQGGGYMLLDAVQVSAAPATVTTAVNDTNGSIAYAGSWFYSQSRGLGDFQDDVHATSTNGDSASYTFTGTGISYITETCSDEGNVQVYLDGTLQATVNCNSANRQVQQAVWSTSGLSSGSHTLKIVKQDGSYMLLDALQVQASAASSPTQPTPYGGSPVTITSSGTTKVEAENYDLGGEGVAYHDVNNGGSTAYRSDNVGIDGISSASNGYGVGSTASGEWDGYTLSVASAGTYTLSAAVSSPSAGGTFHLEFGPVGQVGGAGVTKSGEFTVPNTGSYTTFQTVAVPGVSLPAGKLWMRLVLDSAYPCIFDYFTLSSASTGPAAPTGLTATAGNASVVLNWTAPSGSGLTYNVKRATVSGGPYSTVGGSSGTSDLDSGLTNGTAYYYVVTAVSSAGESGNSNEATATPAGPAADFTVAASPNNFGITPNGTASTVVTITPSSTFSGPVALAVSGLPTGMTASFSPVSPLTVAAGTATSDALTLTLAANAAGGSFTVTATSGSLSHSTQVTLTVAGSTTSFGTVTNLSFAGNTPVVQIQWPYDPNAGPLYASRNGTPLSTSLITTSTGSGSYRIATLNDNTGVQLGTSSQNATTYVYSLGQYDLVIKNSDGTTSTITGLKGTCAVVPMKALATDDQAVDSRLDPRYSTNTFINHNFGSTTYRGGLFAGFNNDPARVGHSLIKFALPSLPSGQYPWRVGSVVAYATRDFTAGTTTSATNIACQRISDNWTGPTATWSLAPAMPSATNGVPVIYNSWTCWLLNSDIYAALIAKNGVLSVGLESVNENSSSWSYFAKIEYDPALVPFVMYAYGAPN